MSGVTISLDNPSIELTLCLTTALTLKALFPSSQALVLCTRDTSSVGEEDNLLSSRRRSWAAGLEGQNHGMLF